MSIETAIFVVAGQKFTLSVAQIPPGCILSTYVNTKIGNNIQNVNDTTVKVETGFAVEEFQIVHEFLVYRKIPVDVESTELARILDYYCVDLTQDYTMASIFELDMRKNMYDPEYSSHEMNTDMYYNLIPINKNKWESLKLGTSGRKDLLFDFIPCFKSDWTDIQSELLHFQELITALQGNCLIAGGKIFTTLFKNDNTNKNNDYDIFLYGVTQEEAKRKIKLLMNYLAEKYKENGYYLKMVRTKNSVTFQVTCRKVKHGTDYQIVLRLYKSPSEILHGFDVDSCCMGYDGKNILMTPRCMHSLVVGYNTVNFERLSPSYELRLVKYGVRGIPIYIPNLDKKLINNDRLSKYHHIKESDTYSRIRPYFLTKELKGLSILLYLEYRYEMTENKRRFFTEVFKLNEISSDYASNPHTHPGQHGNYITDILNFYGDYINDPSEYIKIYKTFGNFGKKYNLKLEGIDELEDDFTKIWYHNIPTRREGLSNSILGNEHIGFLEAGKPTFVQEMYNGRGFDTYRLRITAMIKLVDGKLISEEYPLFEGEDGQPKIVDAEEYQKVLNKMRKSPQPLPNTLYVSPNADPAWATVIDQVDPNYLKVIYYDVNGNPHELNMITTEIIEEFNKSRPPPIIQKFNKVLPTKSDELSEIVDELGKIFMFYCHHDMDDILAKCNAEEVIREIRDTPEFRVKIAMYFVTNTFRKMTRRGYLGAPNDTFDRLQVFLHFDDIVFKFKDLYLDLLLDFPEDIHTMLNAIKPVVFPANLQFKVTNPGEQMTNTFNRIVLEDASAWYGNKFYGKEEDLEILEKEPEVENPNVNPDGGSDNDDSSEDSEEIDEREYPYRVGGYPDD